jgi:putative ABC transport system ATP-binding protein
MSKTAVRFDDVFVLYGNVVALRGLSMDLDRNERVVVRGPSGSGKSTLVNVVTGQVLATAGTLTFFADRRTVAGEVLRRSGGLCVVTQGSGRELLPELNCIRNVALTNELIGASRSEAKNRARETLDRFEIGHLADRMPADISSGEAQLVALAAALSSSPSIIVADEPTGELDRVSAERVYALLSEHVDATGAALLLVSHDQRAEAIADRVLTIRDGRLERIREGNSTVSAVAVDPRGWLRLAEADRVAAGITERVVLSVLDASTAPSLRIQTVGKVVAPVVTTSNESTVLGQASAESVLDGVDVSVTIGEITALSPTSLRVWRGELTVIAGASGSGKTTLLSVLGGLRTPTGGAVTWASQPSRVFAAQVAGFADDASVRENVLLTSTLRGNPATEEELMQLLRALGIDALVDRPVRTLSGGERQRAGVARALLCPAELMLIDEPTSQLDEVSGGLVIAQLRAAARRGAAVVVASHDDAVMAAADTVVSVE